MTSRQIMTALHKSLMACADYFEAACLRRAKIERERLRDSIVTTPIEGRVWRGNSMTVPRTRKAR